ncbi:MAG: NAD+ synthase [Planctomycetota bacterium]|nr:NAD+ synthase [Planctomycetota bacterium]
MKLALAQLNPVVGDIDGNCSAIISAIEDARGRGADVVLLPELAVVGYPPKDLLLKSGFIEASVAAVERIAARCVGVIAVVGCVKPNPASSGRDLFNAAAVCRDGRIAAVHYKVLLPTYDVFDERRYFEPASEHELETIRVGDESVVAGVTICEDLWNEASVLRRPMYHENPIAQLAGRGAKVIFNISASPYDCEKDAFRCSLFATQAEHNSLTIVYLNQVGGNDDLVFDGASAVFDASGKMIARAKAFEEDLLLVDLDRPGDGRVEPYPDRVAGIYAALVLGTRDYFAKCGFKSAVVGLSGGIDSAVTAAIAVESLGAEAVRGVAMPSRYSSDHSLTDARGLADNLGIRLDVVPIGDMHATMEGGLAELFAGTQPGVAEENIQARIRGNILMAICNKFGSLLLTTGNKSELAVGYCTLYGDMCGGLAVISDVPKTAVYELARHVNARAGRELIPRGTLDKPPSAELKPDQADRDSLPPYDVLDAILAGYVENHQSAEEIIAAGHDRATVLDVIRKVDRNEYKRKQAAPGLKVTSRAFGTGRRMPIAARYNS